jgi:hypothetical protein
MNDMKKTIGKDHSIKTARLFIFVMQIESYKLGGNKEKLKH